MAEEDPITEILSDLDAVQSRLWDPKDEDETIAGTLIEVLPGPNRASPTLVVSTTEGEEVRIHLAASDLRDFWKRNDVEVGDYVGFRFKGYGQAESTGKRFRKYACAYRPRSG